MNAIHDQWLVIWHASRVSIVVESAMTDQWAARTLVSLPKMNTTCSCAPQVVNGIAVQTHSPGNEKHQSSSLGVLTFAALCQAL